jgi:hypothetical protein
MSTHPNAMLILVLTPDDLARKTYRAILEEAGVGDDDQLKLGEDHFGMRFHHRVMEDGYDDSHQISAPEGSIVFHTFLTYGYGERCQWPDVEKYKAALDAWANGICERHHCKAEISIGANYW